MTLFDAYQGPHLSTTNRVVLAPMTRNRSDAERAPTALMATYYVQRASAGLLISEAIDVSPGAIGYPGTPGLYTDAQVAGWRRVVQAVRDASPSPFFAQLFHAGRVAHTGWRNGAAPVGPSDVPAAVQMYTPEGMQSASLPQALTVDGIQGVIEEFVTAGRNALQAGFAGVEINAGNGYLVEQFLRDGSNRREDAYGATVQGRVRFLTELVDALVQALGAGKVALRISPGNASNDCEDSDRDGLYAAVADVLQERDLAYLHVIENAGARRITPVLREAFRGTLIANDGYDRASADAAITAGHTDLVSFGRLFVANPDLPRRLEQGAPLQEPDPSTFYGGTHEGYTDYPALD